MKNINLFLFAMIFCLSEVALAASSNGAYTPELRQKFEKKTTQIGVSYEGAQLKFTEGTLAGFGGRVDVSNYFADKYNFDLFLSIGFSSQSSGQSSFTGMGSYFMYSLMGNCCVTNREVLIGGTNYMTESTPAKNFLQIGAGFDQYFLNGSQAVYSASGAGVAVQYDFNFMKMRWKTGLRYSAMMANGQNVTGLFYSAGVMLP